MYVVATPRGATIVYTGRAGFVDFGHLWEVADIGAVAGTNASVWTLLIPIFAIVTVVAAFRDRAPATTAA